MKRRNSADRSSGQSIWLRYYDISTGNLKFVEIYPAELIVTKYEMSSMDLPFGIENKHRATVTEAICGLKSVLENKDWSQASQNGAAKKIGSVCILGAGPCNDLHLPRVLEIYEKIYLVDIDGAVLEQGVQSQRVERDQLELCKDFDVTGIQASLNECSQKPDIMKSELTQLIAQAENVNWSGLPQQVDVTVSTCLLSQLVNNIIEAIGEQHPQFIPLVQAVRRVHCQRMIDQLRPGGVGLLIFDFVSSDTLSALPTLTGEALEKTLSYAIDANNFFHGMNPQVLHRLFEVDLKSQLSRIQFGKPWVWITNERSYAVTALLFQKN